MDDTNEKPVEESEEVTPDADLTEETDWKAEAEKARGIAKRALTKLNKLGEKKVVEKSTEPVKENAPKTGELDEAQLDYLDVKGISEQEDIDIIQKVVERTGKTVRQALKDDYVISKLESNKRAREVQDATPSNTKRSGAGAGDTLAAAIAKYEQSGFKDLPADYALRTQVINAVTDKANSNKPGWH